MLNAIVIRTVRLCADSADGSGDELAALAALQRLVDSGQAAQLPQGLWPTLQVLQAQGLIERRPN